MPKDGVNIQLSKDIKFEGYDIFEFDRPKTKVNIKSYIE